MHSRLFCGVSRHRLGCGRTLGMTQSSIISKLGLHSESRIPKNEAGAVFNEQFRKGNSFNILKVGAVGLVSVGSLLILKSMFSENGEKKSESENTKYVEIPHLEDHCCEDPVEDTHKPETKINFDFPADVTAKVYFDLCSDDKFLGRIEIGLFGTVVPLTCANFMALCSGCTAPKNLFYPSGIHSQPTSHSWNDSIETQDSEQSSSYINSKSENFAFDILDRIKSFLYKCPISTEHFSLPISYLIFVSTHKIVLSASNILLHLLAYNDIGSVPSNQANALEYIDDTSTYENLFCLQVPVPALLDWNQVAHAAFLEEERENLTNTSETETSSPYTSLSHHLRRCSKKDDRENCREKYLHYKGTPLHKIIPGELIEGGDVLNKDGTGGYSIYGSTFPDENLTLKHTCPGILSMANSGPDTNSSRFLITLKPAEWMDESNVVFGIVLEGLDILQRISEEFGTEFDNKNGKKHVYIGDCGVIDAHSNKNEEAKTTRSTQALMMDLIQEDILEESAEAELNTCSSEEK